MWCDGCRHSKDVVVNTDYMTYLFECKIDGALYSTPNVGCPDVDPDPRERQRCGTCRHFCGGGYWQETCPIHRHRMPFEFSPACGDWEK